MRPIIDMEIEAPLSEAALRAQEIGKGRPGTPTGEHLDRPAGYGFANYGTVFGGGSTGSATKGFPPEEWERQLDAIVSDMDRAGIEYGFLCNMLNSEIGKIHRRHPGRFRMFALIDPMDGMRGVRELERLVKEDGANGFRVTALSNCLPASDRRYYPLYAKCVELGLPVKIYSTMNYANDRPYDLGHPRHLDQVAIDFPELKIVAGLGGWPWVPDMVGLLARHPNLFCDTSAHRPRYFAKAGAGWEMFMQFGNSRLQDKIMIGMSRYLFGCPYEELIEEYSQLPLKEKVLEKWFYGNAKRFFDGD
ncbi:amidohydrolase family protein [Nisaea sp.]|uniref:amidohydrolase family protein n=1 Tax=Nisaea sp. TaxID=2024842 RepID=UPI003B5174BD